MVVFPNAKINLGLRILEKRADGYHNIESIFYPVSWCDVLEIMRKQGKGKVNLNLSGIPVPVKREKDNLCVKLYTLLKKNYELPSIDMWLHKAIPIGAGLGGGSSDAAHFMKMINNLFGLNIDSAKMKEYVSELGSDCAFFIDNKPVIATGRGEITEPISLDLSGYYIAVIYPEIAISTPMAYSLVKPDNRGESLKTIIKGNDFDKWKKVLINDFEEPILKLHPEIGKIKKKLYDSGALYASMTGSGSAVYGIYKSEPDPTPLFPKFKTWKGRLTIPE